MEELKFTIFEDTDEPIMLINKPIGNYTDVYKNEDGEDEEYEVEGICGADFQKELLYLDALGKRKIQIWINSGGGVVMDGYNICSAILKSKTPVDTYNVGICASIAGVIFMCGGNRIMMDYATLMIHPPAGSNDFEMMSKMRSSLLTILTAKSKISMEEAGLLMDATTWFTADECKQKGFATAIEKTSSFNKKVINSLPVNERITKYNEIVNTILTEKNKNKDNNININKGEVKMLNVTNRLGLSSDASEDSILKAINAIETESNAKQEKINALQTELDEAKAGIATATQEITDKQAVIDAKEAELQALKDEKQAVKDEKAVEMVTNFVTLGRISNNEEAIKHWTTLAKADFDMAKTMLEDLPVNAAAKKIETVDTTNTQVSLLSQTLNKLK